MAKKPVCEAFWQPGAVFAGEVLDIRDVERADPAAHRFLGSRVVRFRVERAFQGRVGATIEIETGAGDADCGYPFERGEKYLVFANLLQGRLTTSHCGRTALLREATEDLAYVSQTFLPSAGGRVFGNITTGMGSEQRQPASGYTVSLRAAGREWTAISDASGRYEIRDVPPGQFTIALRVSEQEHAHGEQKVQLADARGCAYAQFGLVPNGRIVLPVRMPASPSARVRLQLIEADTIATSPREHYPMRDLLIEKSDEQVWDRLPPGRYLLGINLTQAPTPKHPYPKTFYPGVSEVAAALVIQVGLGERVELEPFVVPASLSIRPIRGTVVRPDSQVVENATVDLLTPEGRYVESTTTDREGRFTLHGIEGVKYRLRGMSGDVRVQSEPFELAAATAPVLLVLR